MHLEKEAALRNRKEAFPWVTVALSGFALALGFWPGAKDLFFYDRARILDGEAWRWWTGHFAHHSASHLAWNLAVFLFAGIWLERSEPRAARRLLLVAPLAISAALWWIEPQLQFYAGLSGLAMGVVSLLTLLRLRQRTEEPRWLWAAALVLLAAKVALEFFRPETALFAGLPEGIRNVPVAHLAGAGCALAVAAIETMWPSAQS